MQTTEEERTLINPSIEWRPTEDVSVLANVFIKTIQRWCLLRRCLLWALRVYNASYGKLGSDAYAGDKWNRFNKEVLMPSVTVNWDINDQLTFKHILRYTDAEAQQRNMYNSGFVSGSDKILNRVAYTTDESMNNWTTDNQLAYKLDTANTSHNLLFGVEYQETDSTATYYDAGADGTPNLDLSQPDFSQINADTLPLNNYRQDESIEQSQLGFYVQDEMKWQDLTIVAGLRHDNFDSITDQTKASADCATIATKRLIMTHQKPVAVSLPSMPSIMAYRLMPATRSHFSLWWAVTSSPISRSNLPRQIN